MKRAIAIFSLVVVAASASLSSAAVTVSLNQSNTFSDNVPYGTVTLAADSGAGKVTFTVDAFTPAIYGTIGKNFGIQTFGFNYDTSIVGALTAADFDLPSGWSFGGSGTLSAFGLYLVNVDGTGNSRQDPLVFSVKNLTAAEAVEANFIVNGAGGAQGTFPFAAHVAGFESGLLGDDGKEIGSHWIAGGPIIPDGDGLVEAPEPASIAAWTILGAAAMLLSWRGRRIVRG